MFEVDNNSSSHTDNLKNDFLILGERDVLAVNGSYQCLSLQYNRDNSYLFPNRK